MLELINEVSEEVTKGVLFPSIPSWERPGTYQRLKVSIYHNLHFFPQRQQPQHLSTPSTKQYRHGSSISSPLTRNPHHSLPPCLIPPNNAPTPPLQHLQTPPHPSQVAKRLPRMQAPPHQMRRRPPSVLQLPRQRARLHVPARRQPRGASCAERGRG